MKERRCKVTISFLKKVQFTDFDYTPEIEKALSHDIRISGAELPGRLFPRGDQPHCAWSRCRPSHTIPRLAVIVPFVLKRHNQEIIQLYFVLLSTIKCHRLFNDA